MAIGFIIGVVGGVFSGKRINKIQFKNLDDIMLLISGAVTALSIILTALGVMENVAVIIVNVFGTMVFSWILTKKSAKQEFKEHEQELALKSYRHINYIDSAAKTAYSTIATFEENTDNSEVKMILGRAMDYIKYIQGGVNTCKLDWYDMLSEADREKIRLEEETEAAKTEYGELKVKMSITDINQEDV